MSLFYTLTNAPSPVSKSRVIFSECVKIMFSFNTLHSHHYLKTNVPNKVYFFIFLPPSSACFVPIYPNNVIPFRTPTLVFVSFQTLSTYTCRKPPLFSIHPIHSLTDLLAYSYLPFLLACLLACLLSARRPTDRRCVHCRHQVVIPIAVHSTHTVLLRKNIFIFFSFRGTTTTIIICSSM